MTSGQSVVSPCRPLSNTTLPPVASNCVLQRPEGSSLFTVQHHTNLKLHKINTGHVDITLHQYLQRSDPRTRGAQRFRHARVDHPALYHSFFHATLRQWNRLPTSLSATTCPEAFRTGLRALTSALISS